MKKIVIIWGVSGAGKTALANFMTKHGYAKIKTTTTRPKRTPDENDYHFVTLYQFKRLHTFAGTKFDGNYYGTDLDSVERQLEVHHQLVIILTWSGVVNYVKEFKHTNVKILPARLYCQLKVVRHRLLTRSDEHITKHDINARINSYRKQKKAAFTSGIPYTTIINHKDLTKQQNLRNEFQQVQLLV